MKTRLVVLLLAASFGTALMAQVSVPGATNQNETLQPNENLIAEGLPPIPLTLVERAGRYTEFRTASVLDWHPVRREILISTRFADVPQIHELKMPGGARRQLTFFPDRTGFASYHPRKGDYFIFSKDTAGGEWYQIFRYDVATGDIALLTDGKSRNLGGPWSNTGDRIAYSSTRRNRGDLDFYVLNPDEKSTDRMVVQNEGGGWAIADWSPDDMTLLVVNEISINESYLYLVDVATGKKTLITPKTADKVSYDPIGFSRDAKGIYATTDKDNEFRRIAYLDLTTRQMKYLSNYSWDVDAARLSYDREKIAFTVNENGIDSLHVLDLSSGKERDLPELPSGVVAGIQWHENNEDVAFSVSSARSPNDVYSINLGEDKLERWTFSETGGLNAEDFVEPQLINWTSFDGRRLSGFLYLPDRKKFPGKRPLIVNIHGGPEGQSRPGFQGQNNYYLTEMGIALVFPNVRGSTGYGKTFSLLDNGFKRADTYKDIEALLRWAKQRPDIDGSRILVTGGSYGGHMTLAIATTYNDLIRCSIDIVGMSSLVTFLEHTEAYRRDLRRAEYGDERDPNMRKYLESIAPINRVTNITKPLFVIQGRNDPRVPISEADQMVKAVRSNGTPVWYLVGKDEGHGFAKKKNRDFQFYSTIMFTQQFLLNGG